MSLLFLNQEVFYNHFFFSCAVSVCFYGHGAAGLGSFPSREAHGTVPFAEAWSFAVSDALCPLAVLVPVPVPKGKTNPGLSASALLGWLFSLHWDRVYCSFFFSSEQAVCLFSCAQHHDSVGSSMASSMLPSPGVEGPWCWDPAWRHGSSSLGHCCRQGLMGSAPWPLPVQPHSALLLGHSLGGTGDTRTAILEMSGALTKRRECESILLLNLPQNPSNLANKLLVFKKKETDIKSHVFQNIVH